VTIENAGVKRRILIECKDFDISGDKVGLDIVRNFWAVVNDTKPRESIIITCNGFTKDARIYAKGKGIKLAVLREFREEDWDGRLKTIAVTMRIHSITEPKIEIGLKSQEDINKLHADMITAGIHGLGVWKGQPVFLNTPEGCFQLNEFIEKKLNEYPRDTPGPVEYKIPLEETTIEVENKGGMPIGGIILKFEIVHSQEYFEITSKKVAELIIEGLEDNDMIIFDEDLKRFDIDETTGEVVLKET